MNIDVAEIEKFDALSQDWWNPDGKLKTLHVINPVRLDYIDERADLREKQVLDIGCGGGILSEAMARHGAFVTGLDASQAAIDVAREHLSVTDEPNLVDYQTGSAEEFANNSANRFDVITCMELLEHVPEPASLLKSCAGMLKPRGHLFLATINRTPVSYASAILGAEYLLGLLPKGTHDYKSFIRPSELCTWLREAGFEVLDISGMTYIPGINHCMLTNRPDVNYLLHARRRS